MSYEEKVKKLKKRLDQVQSEIREIKKKKQNSGKLSFMDDMKLKELAKIQDDLIMRIKEL